MDNQVEKVGNRWRNPQGFELDIRKFPSSAPAGSQTTAESDDIEKFIKMDRKKAQKEICSHIRFIDGLAANKNHWYKRVRSGAVDRPSRGEMRGMVRRDQLAKRRLGMNELVIAPKMGFGTARELCDSLHSTGPDYANIEEGLFCSIETKTLYPICDAEGATGDALCFDVEKEALVHGRSAALVPRQETYKKVMRW